MKVLKPSRPVNDPFIALETKLGKAVFPFQVALVFVEFLGDEMSLPPIKLLSSGPS